MEEKQFNRGAEVLRQTPLTAGVILSFKQSWHHKKCFGSLASAIAWHTHLKQNITLVFVKCHILPLVPIWYVLKECRWKHKAFTKLSAPTVMERCQTALQIPLFHQGRKVGLSVCFICLQILSLVAMTDISTMAVITMKSATSCDCC